MITKLQLELARHYAFILGLALLSLACASVQMPQTTPTPFPTPATFTNPVLDQDFPDPDVLKVGDVYYAYATNGNEVNIQIARSTNLVHWEVLGEALPELPTWAVQSFGWAPDGYRRLYLAPLDWQNDLPVLELNGRDPLPVP